MAIGRLFRLEGTRSACAAKPETDYLYPGGRKMGSGFSNARPTAKPITLPASREKPFAGLTGPFPGDSYFTKTNRPSKVSTVDILPRRT
jgi:hypothetical protein